jgi:hypothetical protein
MTLMQLESLNLEYAKDMIFLSFGDQNLIKDRLQGLIEKGRD